MRFEVPQFIEVEDKIFGPFTWKQFLYLCGGVGAIFLANRFTHNFFLAIIIASPIVAISLALTFYKINGQNFSVILQSAIGYYFRQKLYVWKESRKEKAKLQKQAPQPVKITKNKDDNKYSRIKDVSWGLDVLDKKQ